MIRLTQGDKSHKRKRSRCDPWLSDASASEDARSSQIYKIISCILLYNGAKVLIFYKIKRIDRKKISKTEQNAWFWSRKKAWRVVQGATQSLKHTAPTAEILQITFKIKQKSDAFTRICSLNNVTRISLISQIIVFWWYNKIYGKMSKTSFHNYS